LQHASVCLKRLEAFFQVDAAPQTAELYLELLAEFDPEKLNVAIAAMIEEWKPERSRLPYPSEIQSFMPGEPRASPAVYESPHQPVFHDCKAKGRVVISGSARNLLFKLSTFEGVHIECEGAPHPICPRCGQRSEAYTNPFFKLLTELMPVGTGKWNTHHKGRLLCDSCGQLQDEDNMRSLKDARDRIRDAEREKKSRRFAYAAKQASA
jgi:hypothetical protein